MSYTDRINRAREAIESLRKSMAAAGETEHVAMKRIIRRIQFDAIDAAPTLEDALRASGEFDELNGSYFVRQDYIQIAAGPRALGGFFNPTKANVRKKFARTWLGRHPNNWEEAIQFEKENA